MVVTLASVAALAALAVALLLLKKKLGLFWSAAAFFLAVCGFIAFGLRPPAPASVVLQYMATVAIAMLLYLTSSEAALRAAWEPITRLITEPGRRALLLAALVMVPLAAAAATALMTRPTTGAPPNIRSAHPAPPTSLSFQGPAMKEPLTVQLGSVQSPVSAKKAADPAAFAEALKRGKVVYYQNCYFCHGDLLAGDGHFARAISPPPANFTDPGTIAMLTEGFLFWRVSKGGPGLPVEGTPWDSAMPVWEKYLSADDVWAVIAYLFDATGYQPRSVVSLDAHGGGQKP